MCSLVSWTTKSWSGERDGSCRPPGSARTGPRLADVKQESRSDEGWVEPALRAEFPGLALLQAEAAAPGGAAAPVSCGSGCVTCRTVCTASER